MKNTILTLALVAAIAGMSNATLAGEGCCKKKCDKEAVKKDCDKAAAPAEGEVAPAPEAPKAP